MVHLITISGITIHTRHWSLIFPNLLRDSFEALFFKLQYQASASQLVDKNQCQDVPSVKYIVKLLHCRHSEQDTNQRSCAAKRLSFI